jgi:uncharacterized membrane protein
MFNFTLLISAILFILIDSVYLNLMKNYFEQQVVKVQGSPLKMNFLGAALCYIFLIVGLNYFIIKPKKSVQDAFLLGIVIYGVFETTNYALFKNWSIISVIIDTLWGGILFALTTYIMILLRNILHYTDQKEK